MSTPFRIATEGDKDQNRLVPDPRLASLLAYVKRNDRVCPLGPWARMHQLMNYEGPAPAILAAAHVDDEVKIRVLEAQIRFAAEHGYLPRVDLLLRNLRAGDWRYLSRDSQRRAFRREYRALLRYVRAAGRVCPMPDRWVRFTDLLGEDAPQPLVLREWEASDAAKMLRLRRQIHHVYRHGGSGRASRSLRALRPAEWFYLPGDWHRDAIAREQRRRAAARPRATAVLREAARAPDVLPAEPPDDDLPLFTWRR